MRYESSTEEKSIEILNVGGAGTVRSDPERISYSEVLKGFQVDLAGGNNTVLISDTHFNFPSMELARHHDRSIAEGRLKGRETLPAVAEMEKEAVFFEEFLQFLKENRDKIGKAIVPGDLIDSASREYESPAFSQTQDVSLAKKANNLDANKLAKLLIQRIRTALGPKPPIEVSFGNQDLSRLQPVRFSEEFIINERGYLRRIFEGKEVEVSDWPEVPQEIKDELEQAALNLFDYSPKEALYDVKKALELKQEIESVQGVKVIEIDFRKVVETTLADGRKVAVSHNQPTGGPNISKVMSHHKEPLQNKFFAGPDVELLITGDEHTRGLIRGRNLNADAKAQHRFDVFPLGSGGAIARGRTEKGDKTPLSFGLVGGTSGECYYLGLPDGEMEDDRKVEARSRIGVFNLEEKPFVRPEL